MYLYIPLHPNFHQLQILLTTTSPPAPTAEIRRRVLGDINLLPCSTTYNPYKAWMPFLLRKWMQNCQSCRIGEQAHTAGNFNQIIRKRSRNHVKSYPRTTTTAWKSSQFTAVLGKKLNSIKKFNTANISNPHHYYSITKEI